LQSQHINYEKKALGQGKYAPLVPPIAIIVCLVFMLQRNKFQKIW